MTSRSRGVQRWEQLVDDGSGGRGDVDEELATILRVWLAAHQVSLFEVVEQRGHRPGIKNRRYLVALASGGGPRALEPG